MSAVIVGNPNGRHPSTLAECQTCGYPNLRAGRHAIWCWTSRAGTNPYLITVCPDCSKTFSIHGFQNHRGSLRCVPQPVLAESRGGELALPAHKAPSPSRATAPRSALSTTIKETTCG